MDYPSSPPVLSGSEMEKGYLALTQYLVKVGRSFLILALIRLHKAQTKIIRFMGADVEKLWNFGTLGVKECDENSDTSKKRPLFS